MSTLHALSELKRRDAILRAETKCSTCGLPRKSLLTEHGITLVKVGRLHGTGRDGESTATGTPINHEMCNCPKEGEI